MNEKIKHILIDITVVLVVPFGLFYLYSTVAGPGEAIFGSVQPGSELVGEGQKFLAKLTELQALELDTAVFQSAVYQSLVDTTVTPPTDTKGRVHPFIPPIVAPITPTPSPSSSSKTKSATAIKNLDKLVGN